VYKLQEGFPSTQYFLVENRQGVGFDAGLPGSLRGVLIWHIDETQPDNDDQTHYMVDLEEASGTQHLELNENGGDDADYFRAGNATVFSDSSIPNNLSYAGQMLGVNLTDVGATGASMPVTITTASPLPWSDGFEGTPHDFTPGGWTVAGSATVQTAAKYTGTYGARLAGSTGSTSITKNQSTAGYNTIHVMYDRKVTRTTSITLTVQWSADGGSNWTTLETVSGEGSTSWASKDWALGTTANNNPDFRIRFRTTAGSTYRYAYIDNVQITGTQTQLQYTISGHIQNECNVPVEGVLVDANNGGSQDTTDVNGFYKVWVDYNWSGTVTPGKANYTFDPNSRAYAYVLDDVVDQNYTATNIYDLDCDGSIGFGDLRIISENWLDGPGLPGDFYKDEGDIVNFLDFAEFANHWLED
jgi:hypothetical protein